MIIIIIAINYNKQNVIQESFHGGDIVGFLDKTQGCHILKSSKYFTIFNRQDKIKRKLDSKNTGQIINYYCNNILEFSLQEKQAMNWLINLIISHPNLKNQEIIFGHWNFIKVHNIENNYPHTHKNAIVMPQNIINTVVSLAKKFKSSEIEEIDLNNIDSYELKDILVLMIHEKVHVHQRINGNFYNKLYQDWKFEKAKIKGIEKHINNSRSNPDGDNHTWVFKYGDNFITPIAKFNDNNGNISSVDYLGIYLEPLNNDKDSFDYQILKDKNNQVVKQKLLEIKEFQQFFNINNNHYHPNEISAELISHFYIGKMGYKSDIETEYSSEGMKILEENISNL